MDISVSEIIMDDLLNVKIECPRCGQHMLIDVVEHMKNVECPNCGSFIFFFCCHEQAEHKKPLILPVRKWLR